MTQETNRLYEGMYILSAQLSEDAKQKALDRISNGITTRGGEIHKVFDQGRKKLAYEIRGKREGHYYLIYFSVPATEISEMWKEYHLNEDLIRFLTLQTEEVPEKIEFKQLSS
ncbi:MAG: 30S ribosomal protein S6 [Simkaniaceae bacterium]|nr:30S ribosomal protein S6 [Simkaniaceae bacterium]